jgi:hypothetical protein
MSPSSALQAAIHARLSADPAVQAVLGNPARLHDRALDDAVFPYAVHARIESRIADASEAPASEHVVTMHVWSRHGGAREAQATLEAMRLSLHGAPLSLAGHRLVLLYAVYTDVFRTLDQRTHFGVLRLKAVSEPL